jgi:hypothetical protein
MTNIIVELPDGRVVDTGTDNMEQAQALIDRALRAERPLPGFFQSAVQGARGTFGSAVTGAGTIAGAVGLPGEQTLRGIGEAIAGEEPEDTRNPELADFLTQPFTTARALTGQGLGSVAAFLATGAGAGLLARTVFGLGARATGATAGAAGAQRAGTVAGTVGAGALASTGELEEGLLAEGVEPERARALAASLGPLIGVAETANLAGIARRVLGREMTEEAARQIAQRGMLSAMARTGGREAFLEALTEGGAEAARQGVIAAETGNLNPEERFAAIALGTIAGGLTGGTIGAPGGLVERGAARRQVEAIDASREPPPPGTETEPPPAPDLGAPEPFTTEESAREYLFGPSNDPETLRERARVNPALEELSGQALINEANRIQTEDNLRAQRRIAQSIVDDLLLPQTFNPTTRERNIPAPDEYAREIVRSVSDINNTLPEGQEPISLTGGFTADDITRAAFLRAGQEAPAGPLFNAAAGRANQILSGLVDAGILARRKGKGKPVYTLAAPDPEARAARQERGQAFAQEPQPAPPTAEQSAATDSLSLLTTAAAVSPKDLDARLNAIESRDPAVGQLTRALVGNQLNNTPESQQELLDAINARLPEHQQFGLREDDPDPARSLRMLAVSELEARAGQQPATAILSPARQSEMRDTTRPDAAAIMAQEPAETVEFFRQRVPERKAAFVTENPERAVDFFSQLIDRSPDITSWSFKRIQNAARDQFGIELTVPQASQIFIEGRKANLVNSMGGVPKAPTAPTAPPAPAPQNSAPAPTQASTQDARKTSEPNFFIGERANREPATQAEQDAARAAIERTTGGAARLRFQASIKIGDMAPHVQDFLRQNGYASELSGYQDGDLIVLSLRPDPDVNIEGIAIHEGFHFAEAAGIITQQDVAFLDANRDLLDRMVATHLRNKLPMARTSNAELRAYALNAYLLRNQKYNTIVDRIFRKVQNFFNRLGNYLQGQGFRSVDDIYEAFYSGESARRASGLTTPAQMFSDSERGLAAMGRPIPTNTQNFRDWFGNSVVRNPDGSPKVVYTGTSKDKDFTAFNVPKNGTWFTTDPEAASQYAIENDSQDTKYNWSTGKYERKNTASRVIPTYLKITKPATLSAEDMAFLNSTPNYRKAQRELFARYKAQGYDGVDMGGGVWVVIGAPTQIKSAVSNTGAYSPTDPRINFMGSAAPGARSATSGPILTPRETQSLGFFAGMFGSPTQAGKFNPIYRPVGEVQKQTVFANNEVTIEAEKNLAPLYALKSPQIAQVTRILEEANRTGKAPNLTGLPPAIADGVRSAQKTMQTIFDRFIEAYSERFFAPEAAKTPAAKAALEAMWAKHAGKRLLQIPDADLRAASPEGFKEIQSWQSQRRPNYLPMMMSGSHYMAVYSKDAKGKRNLEKIVFFNPSTGIQKLRGRNEEAYFRQQLEKRYPDRTKFEITKAAPARTGKRTPELRAIIDSRNAVNDFVQTFMDPSMPAKTKEEIAKAMRFLDKQQMSRIFRPFDDKLLAIHDRNQDYYLLDALPQYVLGAGKIYANRLTDRPFRDAIANLSSQDQQHFKTLRAYASMPTEAFGGMRSFQFFWLLGGALDTMTINGLQPLMLTVPMLLRDGANTAHLGSAYRDAGKAFDTFALMRSALSGRQVDLLGRLTSQLRDPAEIAAVTQAEAQGVFTPLYTNESRGQATIEGMQRLGFVKNPRKAAEMVNRWTNRLGLPMQSIEQLNRTVTFLAAYRAAKENPAIIQRANQLDNTNYQSPADYARGMVVTSQFLITKEDRALIQRAYPVMEVATQFMSYPIKAIEQQVLAANQMLRGMKDGDPLLMKAGAFSLLAQVLPLVALAGVWALPLAEPLKELIELAWGNGTNLDRELRELLGPTLGPIASRGVPHATNVANLSRRLSLSPIEFNQMAEPTLLNLLGPTGSFFENINVLDENSPIRRYTQNGDWVGLSTVFTPRFVSNIIRGSSLAAGYDQFTRQGNTIIPAEGVSGREAAATALGFPPPRFTNMRDMVNAVEEQNRMITQQSSRDNMRGAGYLTTILEANRDNDGAALARAQESLGTLMREIAEHNARIYDLALTNPQEFERQLPRLRAWNPNAIRRRAIANFYGISEELPTTQMANQRVRPQLDRLREIYNLQ